MTSPIGKGLLGKSVGEFAEIIEEQKEFIKVKCLYDGYEGWCQRVQLAFADAAMATTKYVLEPIDTIAINQSPYRVSFTTPVFEGIIIYKNFMVDYSNIEAIDAAQQAFTPQNITQLATKFLNTPYLWGGRTLFGIDCSGFAQQVYKLFNKLLPRDAHQQAEKGEALGFLEEAVCGDLAFFDNEVGFITHVGIMLNNHQIIHASGRVRIDDIDNAGIISTDTGLRTHRLRLLKRY